MPLALLFLGIGIAAIAASSGASSSGSSAPKLPVGDGGTKADPVDLQKQLQAAAAKDAADAERRTSETNDKVKQAAAVLAPFTGGASLVLGGLALAALDAMASISKLFSGDPESKEWQDRAIAAYAGALDRGWMPRSFSAATETAKAYASYLESGNKSFDAYLPATFGVNSYRDAYHDALKDPLVIAAATRARAAWDSGNVCIDRTLAIGKPSFYRSLPMFLASVASVHFGIPLPQAISIAYAVPLPPDGTGVCRDLYGGGRIDRPDAGAGDYAGWTYHRDAWKALQAASHR